MTTELTSRPLNVNSLTPRQIVEALDRYVIGQHDVIQRHVSFVGHGAVSGWLLSCVMRSCRRTSS